MRLRKDEVSQIRTIYIGGGTPSQLSTKNLKRLLEEINTLFDIQSSEHIEFTMECNPDDITEEYASVIESLPINRISMGAQTFSDSRLKFIHRRHNAEEVDRATDILRRHGINNISIDLMFGFPYETIEDWKNDINHALSLNVQHISAYSLMYEEGTLLYKMLQRGDIHEIDEEQSLNMYSTLIDMLTTAGYEHYEISNFAKPGFRSRHNSSYWHEIPYMGIGAAAHSYHIDKDNYRRSWNVADIRKYIDSIEHGRLTAESELLDINTRYDDLMTTALRTSEGVNLTRLKREYGSGLYDYFIAGSQKFIAQGLMKSVGDNISLSGKGLYISDSIMSELMHV